MSQLVTPPDIVSEHIVYLVVNAPAWDVEMIVRWLKFNEKKYTIHLYHSGMQDPDWLSKAAAESECVLVHKKDTLSDQQTMDAVLNYTDRIRWFGEDQDCPSAVEYLVKHG